MLRPSHRVIMSVPVLLAAALMAGASHASSDTSDKHRENARVDAGAMWRDTYRYSCTSVDHNFNNAADASIEPQRLFDDVSVIGDRGTAVFVVKTSHGVLLIDSGYSTKTDLDLLPGLKKLGIDAASVKYILLTHGHADHFGGAAYFQSRYATRVVASASDWDLMTHPAPPAAGMPLEPWMSAPAPTRDIVVGDGDEISLGALRVHAYLIPGHTAGALGFVFPVKDRGHLHTAAIFGGMILGMTRISDDGLRQYLESLAHFSDVTRRLHVDVELQNHPLFDDTWIKAAKLASRNRGDANPFVVGEGEYQKFLDVITECTKATLDERTGDVDVGRK